MKPNVSPETIKRLFRFQSGKYYWRYRPLTNFNNLRACNAWNARYGGEEALIAVNNEGYMQVKINDKVYRAHWIAWCWHYGNWPTGQLDHIDGYRANNDIANLRIVNHAENSRNQSKPRNNTSGHVGVGWHKLSGRWYASIRANGRSIHLGMFDQIEDAIAARAAANIKHGFHKNHGRNQP